MRLIMVRHGRTAWNNVGKLQGHSDVPLDEVGREQVLTTAKYLAKEELQGIYTSDLSRAKDTAAAIANDRMLEPVVDRRLRELNLGIWEGLDFNTVYNEYRQEYDAWYGNAAGKVPGGEGVKDVEKRVLDFIWEVMPKHQNETVAIATHGGVVKSVLAYALGPQYLWDQVIDYASITIIKIQGKEFIPELINLVPWATKK